MSEYIDRQTLLQTLNENKIPYDADVNYFITNTPTTDVIEVAKVAEMLNEEFGNECPCNFNDIRDWLPLVCEYRHDCDCSTVKGWEQFIKHYGGEV